MSEPPPRAELGDDDAEDLYDHAPCGYLSTLLDGTIVRVNETFLRLTGLARDEVLRRKRFQDLLGPGDRIFYETHYAPLLRMHHAAREIAVDIMSADGTRRAVLVTSVVTVDAEGEPAFVRTAVFEATERRTYEQELVRARRHAEASEARARELARALQQSFIPPSPPSVPGVEIGAAYRPALDGYEVGGDFYDVFATGPDDWVVAIGDVRGKGVEAARVTALARHTIRAAAMQSRRPEHVLQTLNTAVLRSEEERFCTVAFARLRPDVDGRVRVTLAVAGHPLPFLVDTTGGATAVGEPGDLVGILESPVVTPVDLVLDRGEELVFYTDGVTEARGENDQYGEERLAAFLERHVGEPVGAVVDGLVVELLEFQGGSARDDIAIVILRASESST